MGLQTPDGVPVPVDVLDLWTRLEGQGLIRHLHWWPELASTNTTALALLDTTAAECPRLVWTPRQTAGRGRGTHRWWASPGALTFSLIIDPTQDGFSPAIWPQLSLVLALSVADALAAWVERSRIGLKWPNDVWLDGRKVCGILVEVRGDRLVMGVGLNVQNSLAEAEAALQTSAIALCDVLAEPPALPEALWTLCQMWDRRRRALAAGELDLLLEWQPYCVLTGHAVRLTAGDTTTDGLCRGIDADGRLIVETTRGVETHYGGTVRRIFTL